MKRAKSLSTRLMLLPTVSVHCLTSPQSIHDHNQHHMKQDKSGMWNGRLVRAFWRFGFSVPLSLLFSLFAFESSFFALLRSRYCSALCFSLFLLATIVCSLNHQPFPACFHRNSNPLPFLHSPNSLSTISFHPIVVWVSSNVKLLYSEWTSSLDHDHILYTAVHDPSTSSMESMLGGIMSTTKKRMERWKQHNQIPHLRAGNLRSHPKSEKWVIKPLRADYEG